MLSSTTLPWPKFLGRVAGSSSRIDKARCFFSQALHRPQLVQRKSSQRNVLVNGGRGILKHISEDIGPLTAKLLTQLHDVSNDLEETKRLEEECFDKLFTTQCEVDRLHREHIRLSSLRSAESTEDLLCYIRDTMVEQNGIRDQLATEVLGLRDRQKEQEIHKTNLWKGIDKYATKYFDRCLEVRFQEPWCLDHNGCMHLCQYLDRATLLRTCKEDLQRLKLKLIMLKSQHRKVEKEIQVELASPSRNIEQLLNRARRDRFQEEQTQAQLGIDRLKLIVTVIQQKAEEMEAAIVEDHIESMLGVTQSGTSSPGQLQRERELTIDRRGHTLDSELGIQELQEQVEISQQKFYDMQDALRGRRNQHLMTFSVSTPASFEAFVQSELAPEAERLRSLQDELNELQIRAAESGQATVGNIGGNANLADADLDGDLEYDSGSGRSDGAKSDLYSDIEY